MHTAMKITSRDWIFVTGKAFSGKTYWIKEHAKHVPKGRLAILDFNSNDYQEFSKRAYLFNVETGLLPETEEFISWAYRHGNLEVILSESDNYLRNPSPIIRQFVTTGRNRGIGCIVDAKRPKSVPPDYRTRFNYLVLFQTSLPEDQEYLEDWTGQPKGSFSRLSTLKQGEHIIVDTDNETISEVKKL
jgi:hypothetical protein